MAKDIRMLSEIKRLTAQRDLLQEKLAIAHEALNRFKGLEQALDDSYPDEVIIRCEVTAGDLRFFEYALAKIKGDA